MHACRLNQRHFILTRKCRKTKRSSPDSDVIRCVITITGLCISYWYQFRPGVPPEWRSYRDHGFCDVTSPYVTQRYSRGQTIDATDRQTDRHAHHKTPHPYQAMKQISELVTDFLQRAVLDRLTLRLRTAISVCYRPTL